MFRNLSLNYPGRSEWSDGTTISSHADSLQDYSGEGPTITMISASIMSHSTVPRGYRDTGGGTKIGWYLIIGSGSTTVTPQDIHLASMIELSPTSTSFVEGTGNVLKKVYAKFTNTTSEDIVVREVGLGFGGSTWYRGIYFLAARKVLSSPVTIHVGETYQFSYAIETKEGT